NLKPAPGLASRTSEALVSACPELSSDTNGLDYVTDERCSVGEIMTTGDSAKIIALPPQAIRDAADRGRIKIAMKTIGGVRLFEKSEIERFAAGRKRTNSQCLCGGGACPQRLSEAWAQRAPWGGQAKAAPPLFRQSSLSLCQTKLIVNRESPSRTRSTHDSDSGEHSDRTSRTAELGVLALGPP